MDKILIFAVCLGLFGCSQKGQEKNPEAPARQQFQSPEGSNSFDDLKEAWKNKKQVKELILREKGYSEFPEEIFSFENLEKLDLSMNRLSTLPSDFSQLRGLKSLTVAYNKINRLPGKITGLDNLTYFNLLDNMIKEIPTSFCELNNLIYLNLNGNQINNFPECIGDLKKLRTLAIGSWNEDEGLSISKKEDLKKLLPDCEILY